MAAAGDAAVRCVPVAVAEVVLRYRLWDLISRTVTDACHWAAAAVRNALGTDGGHTGA